MSDFDIVMQELIRFRDERNWEQFHGSKDLALAISIEAAELNELFLWKNGADAEQVNMERLKEELADVFSFCFLLANKHNLDVKEMVLDKIRKNAEKYPINKAKGSSKKYDDF